MQNATPPGAACSVFCQIVRTDRRKLTRRPADRHPTVAKSCRHHAARHISRPGDNPLIHFILVQILHGGAALPFGKAAGGVKPPSWFRTPTPDQLPPAGAAEPSASALTAIPTAASASVTFQARSRAAASSVSTRVIRQTVPDRARRDMRHKGMRCETASSVIDPGATIGSWVGISPVHQSSGHQGSGYQDSGHQGAFQSPSAKTDNGLTGSCDGNILDSARPNHEPCAE